MTLSWGLGVFFPHDGMCLVLCCILGLWCLGNLLYVGMRLASSLSGLVENCGCSASRHLPTIGLGPTL